MRADGKNWKSNTNYLNMDNSTKIIEGLERADQRLLEFKKYKKTPLIVDKDGIIVEISPDKIKTRKNVYKRNAI